MTALSTLFPGGGVKSIQRATVTMTAAGVVTSTGQNTDLAITPVDPDKTLLLITGRRGNAVSYIAGQGVGFNNAAADATIELIGNDVVRLRRLYNWIFVGGVASQTEMTYTIAVVEFQ